MDEAFYRLIRIMGTFDLATGHADSWDELLDSLESELRDVLGHLRAQQCVCGEPKTSGTHRIDGPCYEEQPRAPSPDGEGTLAQKEKIMPITDNYGKAIEYQYRVIEQRGNWFLLYDQHQLWNTVVHEFRIQKLKKIIAVFPGITLAEAQKIFKEKVEADNE